LEGLLEGAGKGRSVGFGKGLDVGFGEGANGIADGFHVVGCKLGSREGASVVITTELKQEFSLSSSSLN